MKGLRSAHDMYAPARAIFVDRGVERQEWAKLLNSVGDQRKQLWFLGDRLLDRLEARMMRDQMDLPPGLNRLVNEYRSLFLLQPKIYRSTFFAHEAVLDVQARLTLKVSGLVD